MQNRTLPLFFLLAPAAATTCASAEEYVDRDLFPKAYGILTGDRLMFPVDTSDWPLEIDESHELFVDNYPIAWEKPNLGLLGRDRWPIPGCSMEEGPFIRKGGLEVPVRRRERDTINSIPTGPVRIAFQMRNASLYSFWIK